MGAPSVLIVGNSDGIGLAVTRRLLDKGYRVLGLSRRDSPLKHPAYCHVTADVTHADYWAKLDELLKDEPVPCAVYYCAGIGNSTNPEDLLPDLHVFDVNLMGAVRTAQLLLPLLRANGGGKFIVLSSLADVIVNHEAASYTASKAAVSSYFEALGLKMRKTNVQVCNVRFGFVDTKMARSRVKPFQLTREQAAQRLERLLYGKTPLRVTYPRRMGVVVAIVAAIQRLRIRFA